MSFGVCMIYPELSSAPPVNQPVCAPGVGDFSVCKAYLAKIPGICFFSKQFFDSEYNLSKSYQMMISIDVLKIQKKSLKKKTRNNLQGEYGQVK